MKSLPAKVELTMYRSPSRFLSFCMLWQSCWLVSEITAAESPGAALTAIKNEADLEQLIGSTDDPRWKQALREYRPEILASVAVRAHQEAVIRTVQLSPGRFELTNATPETLKKLAGVDIPLFDTLTLVDLAIPNAGPHDHRKVDPYDAVFFEHLVTNGSLRSAN
ncbi:MAG: hypothetical protein B7Z47_07765 [Chthoniobacter sp. 12-60-6]|nr:MAG: hypothetical protein B7Z47_07765 [Chthoniobacter sp. 12-60-6]